MSGVLKYILLSIGPDGSTATRGVYSDLSAASRALNSSLRDARSGRAVFHRTRFYPGLEIGYRIEARVPTTEAV